MNFNYNEISDKAYSLHQKGKIEEAEKLYKYLLKIKPDDANILNLLGLLYISEKKEDAAIIYLTKAFLLKKTAYIASNLGKAYYFNEEYTNALKIFDEAIKIEPSEDIYYSIALTYKKMEKYDTAILNYKKALEYNPNNYKTYYNLSLAYKELNDIDNAILYAEKSASLTDKDDEVYTLLAGYYEKKNEIQKSVLALKKATEINPRKHLYFYNLGVLYSKLKKDADAIIAYNTSIILQPSFVEAYVNISTIYKKKNIDLALSYLQKAYLISPDEENVCLSLAQLYKEQNENSKSIEVLEKFLSIKSDSAEAYSLLASNYIDIGEYKTALIMVENALKISPDNKLYLHLKAICLKYLSKIQEAKEILEVLCNDKEASTKSQIALGMIYLSQKQFENGMKLYRNRSKETKFSEIFKSKIWTPDSDITGKTILLYSDCGLGDTIMYARYFEKLSEKCEKIILQTDKELVNILQFNFPNITIIRKTEKRPKYDYVMPIMDIQLALNLDFDNIPSKDKYLSYEKNTNVLSNNKLKIGLFWQGNKNVLKNRSINIEHLKPLFNVTNAEFYSFEVDKSVKCPKEIINLSKYISDYSDTASLLSDLDLLITIDSSIAHMSGALGVKTFLLLPKIAEWRWFNDDNKCSWYNSIKIFRQTEINNWSEVISRVEKEIKLL